MLRSQVELYLIRAGCSPKVLNGVLIGENAGELVSEGIESSVRIELRLRSRLQKNEVIIRMRACGMCGTDLAVLEGRHSAKPPVILGHECAGEVSEIGKDVKSVSVGDHVVVDPNLRCGVCRYCRSDRPNLCENLVSIRLDWQKIVPLRAPEGTVYKVPKEMGWKDSCNDQSPLMRREWIPAQARERNHPTSR